jgi:hypothetical protein
MGTGVPVDDYGHIDFSNVNNRPALMAPARVWQTCGGPSRLGPIVLIGFGQQYPADSMRPGVETWAGRPIEAVEAFTARGLAHFSRV